MSFVICAIEVNMLYRMFYDHKQICVAQTTLSEKQIPLQVSIIAIYIIPSYNDQSKLLGAMSPRKGEIVTIQVVKTSTAY